VNPGLHAARNVAKTLLLLAGFVAALSALGWWLGGLGVAAVFLIVALLIATTMYWYGPRVILASLGARELTLVEAAALHTKAERLAAEAGVSRPRLYVLEDSYPRALSVGRGAGDVGIAVSEGLLGLLPPAELEGILAHELAHARHRDVTIQTPVVLIALWLIEASRIGGWFERALVYILAPIGASLVQVMLSPKRELAADARASEMCGSPHGLAAALVRLDQAMELIEFQGASPATEPLYTLNPFGRDSLASMFATHPPLEERVERLGELDPDHQDRMRAA
jgi:heat shock protein HtpX